MNIIQITYSLIETTKSSTFSISIESCTDTISPVVDIYISFTLESLHVGIYVFIDFLIDRLDGDIVVDDFACNGFLIFVKIGVVTWAIVFRDS